jgi:hypothetical protein
MLDKVRGAVESNQRPSKAQSLGLVQDQQPASSCESRHELFATLKRPEEDADEVQSNRIRRGST